MPLKNIHCIHGFPEYIFIHEIALPGLLAAIGGMQPSIVSRNKVHDHQGDPLALCIWNGPLTLVDPADISPVIHIKGRLIVMPHDCQTNNGPMWKSIMVRISPMSKCRFQFLPCREKHFLSVSHNILSLMAIHKLTSWLGCPLLIHNAHPLCQGSSPALPYRTQVGVSPCH